MRAFLDVQIGGLGIERGRSLFEQLGQRIDSRAPSSRTYSADGGAATRAAGRRILVIADIQGERVQRQTQRICGYDQDGSAGANSQILGAHLHVH